MLRHVLQLKWRVQSCGLQRRYLPLWQFSPPHAFTEHVMYWFSYSQLDTYSDDSLHCSWVTWITYFLLVFLWIITSAQIHILGNSRYLNRTDCFSSCQTKHQVKRFVGVWQPYLYTLVLLLRDPSGAIVDCEACRVGVRQVSTRSKELLVNGEPVVIRGVNRHEHHPRLGKTNIEACMIKVHYRTPSMSFAMVFLDFWIDSHDIKG